MEVKGLVKLETSDKSLENVTKIFSKRVEAHLKILYRFMIGSMLWTLFNIFAGMAIPSSVIVYFTIICILSVIAFREWEEYKKAEEVAETILSSVRVNPELGNILGKGVVLCKGCTFRNPSKVSNCSSSHDIYLVAKDRRVIGLVDVASSEGLGKNTSNTFTYVSMNDNNYEEYLGGLSSKCANKVDSAVAKTRRKVRKQDENK